MKEFLNKIAEFYKKYSDILKPAAILTVIALCVATALAVTNAITVDKIAALATEQQNAAMAELVPDASYDEVPVPEGNSADTVFIATQNGNATAYLITATDKGYGGDVKVMVAVTPSTKKVLAVSILSVADETPGLGQNATKPEFAERFKGMVNGIEVVKNGADASKNQVDAITGATLTSNAVKRAVNTALTCAEMYENQNNSANAGDEPNESEVGSNE